ncbi:MAG: hypothetical protein ACRETC_01460 [Gammaproteobacteria bacterium]
MYALHFRLALVEGVRAIQVRVVIQETMRTDVYYHLSLKQVGLAFDEIAYSAVDKDKVSFG